MTNDDGPMDTDNPTTGTPAEPPPAKKRGPRPWAMLLILAACILTCALFMTRPWFDAGWGDIDATVACPPLSTGFMFGEYSPSIPEGSLAAEKAYFARMKADSLEAQIWIDHTCSDARESRLASIAMVWGFTLLITTLIGRRNIFRWMNLIWLKLKEAAREDPSIEDR